MDLQSIKRRFDIIGNSPGLNYALNRAIQVAPTNLSVLIAGESGVGKEIISQVIHFLSPRKHNSSIAINCGAIPEVVGNSAQIVQYGSSSSLFDGIKFLLNRPKWRQTLVSRGQKRVSQKFDTQKQAKKLEKLYQKILTSN